MGGVAPEAPQRGVPSNRWVVAIAVLLPLAGVLGNTFGWIFTEMGRQPWVVFGLMPTAAGVSPGVSTAEVLLTMIAFTLLYGALAVVEVRLLLSTIRAGLPDVEPELSASSSAADRTSDDEPLVLVY
ncbi:MAG TPA: cytochrome ubiquinol oxidase subunit I [Acidimicrobiales bacterium]